MIVGRSSRESLMSTMMWIGIALTVLFTLGYLFKLIVVWDVSRDLYNGGGVPTMDLPLFYPIFISFGVWAILRSLNALPFPYFGLVVWISIVVLTVGLMGLFDWIGKPLRDEQLRQITDQKRTNTADN